MPCENARMALGSPSGSHVRVTRRSPPSVSVWPTVCRIDALPGVWWLNGQACADAAQYSPVAPFAQADGTDGSVARTPTSDPKGRSPPPCKGATASRAGVSGKYRGMRDILPPFVLHVTIFTTFTNL